MTGYCDLHQRTDCTLCDECGHESRDHINVVHGPLAGAWLPAARLCWAESACLSCQPELERDLRAQLVEATGRAELQEYDVRDGIEAAL